MASTADSDLRSREAVLSFSEWNPAMTIATFDTLKYANTLKQAGVPDKQADAQASVLFDALAVNLKDLVTKDDLAATEERLEARINALVVRSDSKNDALGARLDAKNDALGARLDAKIDALGARLDAKIDLLRTQFKADLREVEQRLGSKFDLIKWMISALIVIGGGILLRLFFPVR